MPDRQKSLKILFKQILLKLSAPLIAGCIWILSSQPVLPEIKGIFGFDKFQHLLAYAVFSAAAGLWPSPAFRKRHALAALLLTAFAGSCYGAIDEVHQYFVPGRNSNIWDWLADTIGAILGAAAVMIALPRLAGRIGKEAKSV